MNLSNHYEILDVLFNELPFVFWKSIDGIYLGVNESQAREFGLAREEIIGKTIFEILEDQDAAQEIDDTDNEIMRSGEKMIVEESIIKADGEFTYLSQKSPIFDENNTVIGLIGFAHDITHYKNQINFGQSRLKECVNDIQGALLSCKFDILNSLTGAKSQESLEYTPLSGREKEIISLLSMGKQAKEISSILFKIYGKKIEPSTVAGIINKRLYRKLQVSSLSKLIEKANALGLIPFMPETFLES